MNNLDTKFTIHYVKQKPLHLDTLVDSFEYLPEDLEHEYNPFQIKTLQNYNPIYSLFFDLNEKTYNKIALNHPFHFINMNKVMDYENKIEHEKPVFIKYAPLIDPIRYMTGKYKGEMDKLINLPKCVDNEKSVLPKISYYNNASYTDNFFSYLASRFMHQHQFIHSVDYYGSFLGIQDKYKANISDDLEYLNSSEYFAEKINKLFTVSIEGENEFANFGSRSNKKKLVINNISKDELGIEEIELLENLEIEIDVEKTSNDELVYEKEPVLENNDNSSNNSEANYSDNETNSDSDENTDDSEEDEDWETESSESTNEYEEENNQYAFIKNFPVQLICLEKCSGTMDELFVKQELNEEIGIASLMQIIMILVTFQKAFHFTHNDLHTNNIMYVNTDKEYLYYRYDKKVYKVPTYGKIFKIIDFGRSVYKFNSKSFFSDSFATGGDGATQYNCEPFFNEKKHRVDPNYSFDLSRLGASIYDFIIEDDKNPERFDKLQKIIYRWCLDDNNKNILYKKNGEERYPNFKLYKMIARTVHNHTPDEQLKFSEFKRFVVDSKKINKLYNIDIMYIDNLTVYI